MPVDAVNLCWIRDLCVRISGNVLEEEKSYLVEARLTPLALSVGLTGVDSLIEQLRVHPDGELERRIVEAMLIHESSFFRDANYFDALRTTILPQLIRQRSSSRSLTIWCAACAAGQEAYSLAMLLQESLGPLLDGWRLKLIASDLSRPMLQQARSGSYSELENQRGVSIERRRRFFRFDGRRWIIREELRRMVEFRELNLLHGFPGMERADLVLLRNVLIYLDIPARHRVLANLARSVALDGCLLLGATETLHQDVPLFRRIPDAPVPCYRPAADATSRDRA